MLTSTSGLGLAVVSEQEIKDAYLSTWIVSGVASSQQNDYVWFDGK